MTFSHLDHDNKVTTMLWTQEHLHNKYNRYAALFYTCETSNLLIVISQILVINKFLNYQFLSYGFNVSLDDMQMLSALYINIYLGLDLVLSAARGENYAESESDVWGVPKDCQLWLCQVITDDYSPHQNPQHAFFQIWSGRTSGEEERAVHPRAEHDQW